MNINLALNLPFETPHMVVDLDQVKKNVNEMQHLADKHGKKLCPHSKTHKIPEISRIQIESGATGICVQKVSEAEVMFEGGVRNILISNEVIGTKLERVAKLLEQGCSIRVAFDNPNSINQYSKICSDRNIEGHVLLDLNIGMNRCGVDISEFSGLLDHLLKSKNLVLDGIMAYDGHVSQLDLRLRQNEVKKEEKIVMQALLETRKHGIDELEVSVSGTRTVEIWAESEISTELQPGTYVYYDTHYINYLNVELRNMDRIAMGLVSTVMSEKIGDRYVLDAGSKSVSLDQGVNPSVVDENGKEYKVLDMSEEHCVIKTKYEKSMLGKKFMILPYHACNTSDMWDGTYFISTQEQPRYVKIEGRGKRE